MAYEQQEAMSVLISLAFGDCILVHAGGVFGRSENFPAGKAFAESLDGLKLADVIGGIIASRDFWNVLNSTKQEAFELTYDQEVHANGFVKIFS